MTNKTAICGFPDEKTTSLFQIRKRSLHPHGGADQVGPQTKEMDGE